MKPAPFDVARPRELSEVLDLLSSHRGARVIAGGQSLIPLMNMRLATPALLIDLGRVNGLAGISRNASEVRIGSMTRQKDLQTDLFIVSSAPLIAAAIPFVGHVQTRNLGTIGGSLAHADPGAELPLVMSALNATIIAQSKRGMRVIAAEDFFLGSFKTNLSPDELLTEIRLPSAPAGTRVAFREFSRRHGDLALAAAAAQLSCEDGGAVTLRAAIGGIGSVPHVCHRLSAEFRNGVPSESLIANTIEKEIALLRPQPCLQASVDYRRHLASLALFECVRKVIS